MSDSGIPTTGRTAGGTVTFECNGAPVSVPDEGASLLDVLRERLGLHSPKDGCAPQGQCGCCTVLVDGAPRVACVTPVRRVAGRTVTTLEGLDPEERGRWAEAFACTGASQCGFCTPGIILRLVGAQRSGTEPADEAALGRALAAHLCRCTGWRTIGEAYACAVEGSASPQRDETAAARRAALEGHTHQAVGPAVALGEGGFATDTAPPDALVAIPDHAGGWVVAETLIEARRLAGRVQGRRTTRDPQPPIEPPEGEWVATLATSWVEPAYLETDAAWCEPGGEPYGPLANGGAFGAKTESPLPAVARRLADEQGRPVRVLWSREDVVRHGPKRPPVAGGVRADGTGVLRVARTPGIVEAVAAVAPGLVVEEVDVAGPPTSAVIRAAGWAEAVALVAAATGEVPTVTAPEGGTARAWVVDGGLRVEVDAGDPLDAVVLRSYCIGAAHMAYSQVTSEGLAVAADGTVEDLTIRSFGVVRAQDTPDIEISVVASDAPPVPVSDAVFAAVMAAVWLHVGTPPTWPTGTGIGSRP